MITFLLSRNLLSQNVHFTRGFNSKQPSAINFFQNWNYRKSRKWFWNWPLNSVLCSCSPWEFFRVRLGRPLNRIDQRLAYRPTPRDHPWNVNGEHCVHATGDSHNNSLQTRGRTRLIIIIVCLVHFVCLQKPFLCIGKLHCIFPWRTLCKIIVLPIYPPPPTPENRPGCIETLTWVLYTAEIHCHLQRWSAWSRVPALWSLDLW